MKSPVRHGLAPQQRGIAEQQEACLDVLGQHSVRHGMEHQPPGQVALAHRAAGPVDDLRR